MPTGKPIPGGPLPPTRVASTVGAERPSGALPNGMISVGIQAGIAHTQTRNEPRRRGTNSHRRASTSNVRRKPVLRGTRQLPRLDAKAWLHGDGRHADAVAINIVPRRRRRDAFDSFAKRFLKDCRGRWKPNTFKAHSGQVANQLVAAFGHLEVAQITRHHVVNWYEDPKTRCPRALSVLSSIMRHAEHFGLRPHGSNPCKGLRRREYKVVAAPPGPDEYKRLGSILVLEQVRDPTFVALIYFLALTGARLNEAITLQWRHLAELRAILEDSKEGPRTVWLAPPVITILDGLPRTPKQKYVFGNARRALFSGQMQYAWRKLRGRHGLRMRMHDLRHGFATVGVNMGLDLQVIGRLLGHRDLNNTLVYAHLADKALREAAMRVGKAFRQRLEPQGDRAQATPSRRG